VSSFSDYFTSRLMERTVNPENPIVSVMPEVLTQNAEAKLQRGEEPRANRPTSLVRSLSFKYYIHDSVAKLRFQLVGDLCAANVSELNGSWETARTTLGSRRFVLDIGQLFSSDSEGRGWLLKMGEAGAEFSPAAYLEFGEQNNDARIPEQVAAVRLSVVGRVIGMIRGER
jgi:hypothetical protein